MASAAPADSAARRLHRRAILAVAAGGALGAPARYEIGLHVHAASGSFPWATFWINVSGAFLLGVFATLVLERLPASRYARPFVAVGFLGAYTTYSTMAVDTVTLLQHGHIGLGVVDLVASVAGGLGAVYAGILSGRALPSSRSPARGRG